MDGKSILLLALIYTAVIQDVKAAKLTITPSQNLQAGATSLTLRCSADANSNYIKLRTLTIYKKTKVSSAMAFAIFDPTASAMHGAGIKPPKYKISLDLTPQLLNKALEVVIHNPDCHDGAEYTCETSGEIATSSHVSYSTDSKNVTVPNNPGTVEMKIFPEQKKYEVGDKIEITCQTGVENPEKTWSWESIPRVDPSYILTSENIRESQVDPQTSTQCGYNTVSTLHHHVGMEDDGLKIRCMVDNSELNSAITTLYLTLDDVKKRLVLADTERVKLEQEKLKQQISCLSMNTTSCNSCCN